MFLPRQTEAFMRSLRCNLGFFHLCWLLFKINGKGTVTRKNSVVIQAFGSVSVVRDFICLAKRKEVENSANETAIKCLGSDRWSVFVVTDLL